MMSGRLIVFIAFLCIISTISAYDPDFSNKKVGESTADVSPGRINAVHKSQSNRKAILEGRKGSSGSVQLNSKSLSGTKSGSNADAKIGSKSATASKGGGSQAKTANGAKAAWGPKGGDTTDFNAGGRKGSFDGKVQSVSGKQERRVFVKQGSSPKRFRYQKNGNEGQATEYQKNNVGRIDNVQKGAGERVLSVAEQNQEPSNDKTVRVAQSSNGYDAMVPIKVRGLSNLIPKGLAQPFGHVSGRREQTGNSVRSNTFVSPRGGFINQVPQFDENKPASKAASIAKSDNTGAVAGALNSKREEKLLYESKLTQGQETECSGNFQNQNDKTPDGFKYENMKVNYAGKQGQSYDFPNCYDVTGDVTIPAGVTMKDLAMSLYVFSPTCGQMQCGGDSRCNGIECFLEDICQDKPRSGGSTDDIGNYFFSKTTTDACNLPASGGPSKHKLNVQYCPDPEASTSFRSACDSGVFGLNKGKNNKHAVVVQANVYEKSPGFQCSHDPPRKKKPNFPGEDALKKRACKEYHIDFGVGKKGKYNRKNEWENVNCARDPRNNLCAGASGRAAAAAKLFHSRQ